VDALRAKTGTPLSLADRRKTGSKHHLITDGAGIPFKVVTTAANVNNVTQTLVLIDGPRRAGAMAGVRAGAGGHELQCSVCCIGCATRAVAQVHPMPDRSPQLRRPSPDSATTRLGLVLRGLRAVRGFSGGVWSGG